MTDTLSLLTFSDPYTLQGKTVTSFQDKYPDRVPIILEPYPDSNDTLCYRILVPKDITVNSFISQTLKHVVGKSEYAIMNMYVREHRLFSCIFPCCMSLNLKPVNPAILVSNLYAKHVKQDGILYLCYRFACIN